MNIGQKRLLGGFNPPLDRNILKNGGRYFACPLTLDHLARAPAAVTHSMTEWYTGTFVSSICCEIFSVNGPPIAPTSIGFFFCFWKEARTFTIDSSRGSSWNTNQGMMISILGSSINDCIANR